MCRMIVWFWGSYSEPKCWILYDLHDSTGTFAGPLPPSSGGHFSAPDQQTPRGIEPAEQYPLCLLRVACHWWHWVLVLPYWEAFEKLLKKSRAACVGWMSSCGDLYPYDLWHDMHASKARRSRSGGNWCQPPTGLVFSQPYLHQAAPKHSRDRRLLKSDLGRLYDVIVSYISNFVFAYYIVLYTLYDYSKTYMLYIYIYICILENKHVINYSSIWFLTLFSQGHRVGVATFFAAFCNGTVAEVPHVRLQHWPKLARTSSQLTPANWIVAVFLTDLENPKSHRIHVCYIW